MAHEQILALLPLLLHGAVIIVIGALILGKIIVNFPLASLKFMLDVPELLLNPFNFLIKMLRLISLLQLLKWLNTKVEERCFDEVSPLTLPEIFIILFSSAFLLISSPSEIILEELAIIGFFSALIIYKVLTVKYIKSLIRQAKFCERAADNAYKRGSIPTTLSKLRNALDIYKKPLLLDKHRFALERAKLFEQIGIVLYNDYQTDKALDYFRDALNIYREPQLIFDEAKLMKCHIKAITNSAKILTKMGRRGAAWKRYEFIYELTGKSIIPSSAFKKSLKKPDWTQGFNKA
jgi:tetratricopeptide (TPR) repeat protein